MFVFTRVPRFAVTDSACVREVRSSSRSFGLG
jgi:hypothetical protein